MSNTVPEGWSFLTVGNTCEVLDSKRVPINSQDRALREGIYPYYGANGVQGYIDDFIFEGEHVLLAEDGGYFDEWDSRPISYLVTGKFWVNNHAHILRANSEHETRFVHYSLVHKNILKHINGGTRAKLNQSDMRQIEYLAPPLPEQQKIAAILSSVDDVIKKTRAQIDKLKDLKTGMMQELLTKGIGHTAFKDSPVGRIPEGWSVVAISDCTTRFYQGINTVADKVVYKANGVPIIQAKHMTSGHLTLDEARYVSCEDYEKYKKKFQPNESDILFSNIGTIGKSVIIDKGSNFLIAWNVFLMRVEKYVSPRFMHYTLQYLDWLNFYDDLMTGNATKFVNKSSLGAILIRVPSRTEQEKITTSIGSVDSRITHIGHRLDALMKVKKSLMQDLLTGKVRVNVDNKENAVA